MRSFKVEEQNEVYLADAFYAIFRT